MIEYKVKVYNDRTEWYLNDKLHREDGPAVEWSNGTKEWFLNDKLHREDGPACEYKSGSKNWYLNGKLHREDGPAIEYTSGNKSWFLNGKRLTEKEFNERNQSHIIQIDGKEIKLSHQSFQELKQFFKGE